MAILIRDDGTLFGRVFGVGDEIGAYVVSDGILTLQSEGLGELHFTIENDGKSLFNLELQESVSLCENHLLVADDDFLYIYNEDNECYGVSIIDVSSTKCGKIKDSINGINVSSIASDGFKGSNIEEISIPSFIKHIGNGAFARSNLKSIVVPSTVE